MKSKDSALDLLINEFIEEITSSSLNDIKIVNLINRAGFNRNTFYYYFANKFDICAYLFMRDLDQELREIVPGKNLVIYKSENFGELAYYTFIEAGAHMIDSGPFFNALLSVLNKRYEVYKKVFSPTNYTLISYFDKLWKKEIEHDLKYILGNRRVHEDVWTTLVQCRCKFINDIIQVSLFNNIDLASLMNNPSMDFIWNSIYVDLYRMLKSSNYNILDSTLKHPHKRN